MNKINFILQIISILLFSKFVFANDQNLISDIKIYNEDKTINAVIEIPAGTLEKWEISKDGKKIEQEIHTSQMRKINYLAYPFNYGFVPQTVIPVEEGGDGEGAAGGSDGGGGGGKAGLGLSDCGGKSRFG